MQGRDVLSRVKISPQRLEFHIFASPLENVHRKVGRIETLVDHQIMRVHWLSGHTAQNWVVCARLLMRTGYSPLLPLISPLLLDGVERLNCFP